MPSPSTMLTIVGVLGTFVAIYVVYLEHKLDENPNHQALCDLETLNLSCSTVLKSDCSRLLSCIHLLPKGHILDFSNGEAGLIFYPYIAVSSFAKSRIRVVEPAFHDAARLAAALATAVVSAFLGYVMVTDLKETCIVCSSLYVLNAIILYNSFREARRSWSVKLTKTE